MQPPVGAIIPVATETSVQRYSAAEARSLYCVRLNAVPFAKDCQTPSAGSWFQEAKLASPSRCPSFAVRGHTIGSRHEVVTSSFLQSRLQDGGVMCGLRTAMIFRNVQSVNPMIGRPGSSTSGSRSVRQSAVNSERPGPRKARAARESRLTPHLSPPNPAEELRHRGVPRPRLLTCTGTTLVSPKSVCVDDDSLHAGLRKVGLCSAGRRTTPPQS